ncbi:hypothetical protein EMIT0P265_90190 [Pseudomonas zeae]
MPGRTAKQLLDGAAGGNDFFNVTSGRTFGLLFQMHLQIRVDPQCCCQFIQIAALGVLLVIHEDHADQIHFSGHGRIAFGRLRDFVGVQRFRDFVLKPLLQLWVVGVFADFPTDHLLFPGVDLTVSLGRRDQRAQYSVAVLLDFRAGKQIGRLRDLLRCRTRLAALPRLIRLERHHAQRRERRIIGPAGTILRAAPAAQRPTQSAAKSTTGTAAEQTTEQAAQAAKSTGRSAAAGRARAATEQTTQ